MADQLLWLGKRDLVFLLLFNCNYVVSVQRGFLFLLVLEMGSGFLLWHSLGLPYNYFTRIDTHNFLQIKQSDTCDAMIRIRLFSLSSKELR